MLEAENRALGEKVSDLKQENTRIRDKFLAASPLKEDRNKATSEMEIQDLMQKLDERNKERLQYKEILKELQENIEKKNKEKGHIKELLKVEQDRAEAEMKKRIKVEEYAHEIERKLENEIKKRLELEKEVERKERSEELERWSSASETGFRRASNDGLWETRSKGFAPNDRK